MEIFLLFIKYLMYICMNRSTISGQKYEFEKMVENLRATFVLEGFRARIGGVPLATALPVLEAWYLIVSRLFARMLKPEECL